MLIHIIYVHNYISISGFLPNVTVSPPNVTVSPPNASCIDFDLRLTDTSVTLQGTNLVYSGTVETCVGGTYLSICDTDWDDVEAQLICNAVGYYDPLFRKFYIDVYLCT